MFDGHMLCDDCLEKLNQTPGIEDMSNQSDIAKRILSGHDNAGPICTGCENSYRSPNCPVHGSMKNIQLPSLAKFKNANGEYDRLEITKVLLAHLWSMYDANGESMGRSFQGMILELAIELIGRPTNGVDFNNGDFLNEVKTYLSKCRLAEIESKPT